MAPCHLRVRIAVGGCTNPSRFARFPFAILTVSLMFVLLSRMHGHLLACSTAAGLMPTLWLTNDATRRAHHAGRAAGHYLELSDLSPSKLRVPHTSISFTVTYSVDGSPDDFVLKVSLDCLSGRVPALQHLLKDTLALVATGHLDLQLGTDSHTSALRS